MSAPFFKSLRLTLIILSAVWAPMLLTLIQSVIFDVDSADGWARFANTDDGSLRGQLRVRARNNSQLGGDQKAKFSLEADESAFCYRYHLGKQLPIIGLQG